MSWLKDMWGLMAGSPVSLALADTRTTRQPVEASHHPSWSGMRSVGSTARTVGLTPQRLAAYLRQAEDGDPQAQAELLRDIEGRDTRLMSVLGTRKRALAGLPYRIVPPSERRTDARISQYVEDVFAEIPAFRTSLIHMMDAVSKGYSGLEIDWRQGGGLTTINGLLHRPAHWFRPTAERPDVWGIVNDSGNAEALEPNAWVWHEMTALSGSTAAGGALGRALAWVFLFRSYTLKDWLIFAETYGAPLRVGRYRPGTSETDRRVLYQALQHLGVDAAAIIPEGCSIEFPAAQNKGASVDVYRSLVEWGAAEYAVAVLGQTLTTSEGQHGTQALGSVHADVRQDLLESDAEQVSETITAQLVRPLVQFQFGPQRRYPKFRLVAEPAEDLAARAKLYVDLAKIGVRFDKGHVHETFGVPEPDAGAETYGTPQEPDTDTDAKGDDQVAASDHIHGPECGLALADPTDALGADVVAVVRRALNHGGYGAWEDVLEHLRRHVQQASSLGDISARLVAALRQLDLDHLASEVAAATLTGELVGRAQVELGDVALGEWPKVNPLKAEKWWRQKVPMTSAAFRALGEEHTARAFSIAGFTSLQAVEAIADLQRAVIEEGMTIADFEDRFDSTLSAHEMEGRAPHRVQLVFRNNTNSAYHGGRWAQQSSPRQAKRRPYLLYDAMFNARPTHAAMDRKVYPVGHPIWQTWYPLNGHNCRCRVRALTAAEVAQMGLTISDALPRIRQTLADGRVVSEPAVPDHGWRRNPGMEPHEFDFSGFPFEWRDALGVAA